MDEQRFDPADEYIALRDIQVEANSGSRSFRQASADATGCLIQTNYIKNFTWLGRPIMQYPMDLMILQEIIFESKPDLIIETGIAFGGSTLFYASMLHLLDGIGRVVAVDKEIRPHNRIAIESSPLHSRIVMIEGDSVAEETAQKVYKEVAGASSVMLVLDSNHTEDHVLRELLLYSHLVSIDNYCVVCDTAIEFWSDTFPQKDRPWGRGNNPYTAMRKFLKNPDYPAKFKIHTELDHRAFITGHPMGYLRRIR